MVAIDERKVEDMNFLPGEPKYSVTVTFEGGFKSYETSILNKFPNVMQCKETYEVVRQILSKTTDDYAVIHLEQNVNALTAH